MCGICGVFNYKNNKHIEQPVLKKMADTIIHRGPDDEGYYTGFKKNGIEQLGLAMRRLSIIDLQTGHQPIHNEDKTIWVVFNGEIYNFQELKQELAQKGHTFQTHTDTEVIVHMYEEYGKECVKYFRGMFAIAIADERTRTLTLIRDRIGKKPLYYSLQNGSLIFGSEIKALLAYPNIKTTINLDAINLFLTYQYIPSPITIFNEIQRLPPASILTCGLNGEIRTERYWDLDFTKKTNISFDDACLRIREILTEATKLRLISDVPLGVFLSGGHDSSIIVALMSQLSSGPVKTFSIGFEDHDFSELKYAKIIADYYKTDHHEFIVKPHFKEILPKIVWHYDQPYADSSALPTYYVSKITRPHVKVALNGDGGDENFAGYLRHQAMKGSAYFSPPFRLLGKNLTLKLTSLLPLVESSKSKSRFKYMNRLFTALYETPARRDVLWHAYFKNEVKYRIYSQDMMQKVGNNDAYNYLANVFNNSPAKDILDRTLYTDIMTYLPECLCVKMDVASMANSLETRSPLLDHKLFEFTSTLPSHWKLKGLFKRKHILKETFKKDLPPAILNRGKQGFGSPVGKWFRNDWKDYFREIVLSNNAMSRGYFKKQEVEGMFNEHISGQNDYGYCMYALLMLELWHNVFIDKYQ